MSPYPRALVLDVTLPPGLRAAEAALVRRLASALPQATLIRAAGTRLVAAGRAAKTADDPQALRRLRSWLAAPAGSPRDRAPHRPSVRWGAWPDWRRSGIVPHIPQGATLLVPTLAAWAGPVGDLVAQRPDLRIVALQAGAAGLDWPEHDPPITAARLAAARMRCDRLGVKPAAGGAGAAMPSRLAGTRPPARDAVLAGAPPIMVAWGTVEMRTNSALLLQLWRDRLEADHAPPRLVLAGARGVDAEEIHPLLDWNPALRAHVIEAPALGPQDLRTLLAHAHALLCPGFVAADSAALVRDAGSLGVPVLAAPDPGGPAGPAITRIGALDGLGWRAAILAAAGSARVAPPSSPPPLADWPAYAAACLSEIAP